MRLPSYIGIRISLDIRIQSWTPIRRTHGSCMFMSKLVLLAECSNMINCRFHMEGGNLSTPMVQLKGGLPRQESPSTVGVSAGMRQPETFWYNACGHWHIFTITHVTRPKFIQASYNTPLEHTPGNPPTPTMKGFPLQPVGKGLGVCSKGVLKQP